MRDISVFQKSRLGYDDRYPMLVCFQLFPEVFNSRNPELPFTFQLFYREDIELGLINNVLADIWTHENLSYPASIDYIRMVFSHNSNLSNADIERVIAERSLVRDFIKKYDEFQFFKNLD